MPTSDEIARELESFYRHYIDVFNREDAGFFNCFAHPYAAVSERGLAAVANDDDNRTSFGRTMATLKQHGWARSGIDSIKAWALADNFGMILSDVTRYRADGSTLEKIRACYLVRRDGAGWKIMTISEIRPPFLGPGDIARV